MKPPPLPRSELRMSPVPVRILSDDLIDAIIRGDDGIHVHFRVPDGVPEGPAPGPATPPEGPVPGPGAFLTTAEAAARLGIDRGTLDAMIARAPRTLPGGPVRVGEGTTRRHLRWPAATLESWVAALRVHEASRGKRKR